jgi:biopolymer transport protein ExbD
MSEDTKLELPTRKRNPDDGEMDVTPMIDVTFLLLAFFVVVSRMDPQAAVDLPLASYGDSIQDKAAVSLIVGQNDNDPEKVDIYKGRSMAENTKVPDGDEESQEANIGEYVENELSAHPTKSAILIKAEGQIKTGMVEMVKRGIGQSELSKLNERKLYVGIEEER